MIYTEKTKAAMKLCFEAHMDQMDKSAIPYVFHPYHLAEQMETEETVITALLHDILEDTDYTAENLRKIGFSEAILTALKAMTHTDDVPYLEYVAQLKSNPIACTVKLADLRHNSDLSRLNTVDEKALARVDKYKKAISILET